MTFIVCVIRRIYFKSLCDDYSYQMVQLYSYLNQRINIIMIILRFLNSTRRDTFYNNTYTYYVLISYIKLYKTCAFYFYIKFRRDTVKNIYNINIDIFDRIFVFYNKTNLILQYNYIIYNIIYAHINYNNYRGGFEYR